MSYLGRKGAVAPLTSGDIPDGVIEGRDIAFFENGSTTQNLSGTYSTERMYLNDSYTLTGDVNITNHLALGTVGDADVIITQDSTERTITGSGTLESGDLLHRGEETLTGMTGELGSAVTGSPNLNLGNATFPAGHVLQTVSTIQTTVHTVYSSTKVDVGLELAITPSSTANDILVFVDCEIAPMYVAGVDGRGNAHLLRDSTVILDQPTLGFYLAGVGTDSNIYTRVGFHRLDSPATTNSLTYKIQVGKGNAGHFSMNNGTGSSITLMEIKR